MVLKHVVRSVKRTMKIFYEDQATVESQRPELLPFDLQEELHSPADKLQLYYRKVRQRYLDKGWGIDSDGVADARSKRRTVVIPSPSRRAEGLESAFVLGAVPNTPTKGTS